MDYPEGLAGKNFSEKKFTGAIQKQLVDVLDYLKRNVLKSKTIKYADTEKVDVVYNYPFQAIEEALSNAVYHKNYEIHDPIEIRVLPESIEIISFNGVDPSLRQADFDKGRVRARRYRNRRIGEFLKELRLTEGRGTGIPTIVETLKTNDSPKAIFDTNEPDRIHFLVEIPIQSAFVNHVSNQANDLAGDQVDGVVRFNDIKMLEDVDALIEQLSPSEWDQVKDQVRDQAVQLNKHLSTILFYCQSPRSRKEVCERLQLSNKDSNFKRYAGSPLSLNWIEMTSNPHNKDVKYVTTVKGRKLI